MTRSMVVVCGAAGSGSPVSPPPSDDQFVHTAPVHLRVQTAPSFPAVKTSIVLVVGETAPGPDDMPPPSNCQPDQTEPFHARCHRALSVPRAKTSRRFGPHEATSGS